MHSLPVFLRLQGKPVVLVGEDEAAQAKRRLLERAGARVVSENAPEDARLAIVAVEDDAEAEAAVARLRARGLLVNATDRSALCDFTLPAIVDRDPVLIAIGTGGASAGLAKALRIALETLLPASLGTLASALMNARGRIRKLWPDPAERRRAIDEALAPGGPLDPLAPTEPGAVERWLGKPFTDAPSRLIAMIVRSDDPDDLTLKEARLLGQADRIHHAPDVPVAILDRARADAVRVIHIDDQQPAVSGGLSLWLRRTV